MITGLTGIGATRKSVTNIHNDVAGGFAKELFSCIAMLKPFTVRFVGNTNLSTWLVNIVAKPGTWLITWPPEEGYSSGGTISVTGGLVDYTLGAPDIESRVDGEMTIKPSGAMTIVAGTPAS